MAVLRKYNKLKNGKKIITFYKYLQYIVRLYVIDASSLPGGQDLQSEVRFPGALAYGTKEPFGHFLHPLPT